MVKFGEVYVACRTQVPSFSSRSVCLTERFGKVG